MINEEINILFLFDLEVLTYFPYVLKIVLMILNAKKVKSVIMGNALNVPMIINVEKGKNATCQIIHVWTLAKGIMTVNQENTVILTTKFVSPNVN